MHAGYQDFRANVNDIPVCPLQSTGQGLFFDGDRVDNHSMITLDQIKVTTSKALICATMAANCTQPCSGAWFNPNGTAITTRASSPMYQFRGTLYAVLRQKVHYFGDRVDTAMEGLYYCEVTGSVQSRFYVGLYKKEKGECTVVPP